MLCRCPRATQGNREGSRPKSPARDCRNAEDAASFLMEVCSSFSKGRSLPPPQGARRPCQVQQYLDFVARPGSSRPNPQVINTSRYSPRLLGSELGKLPSELASTSHPRGNRRFGRLGRNEAFKGWLMRFLPLLSAPFRNARFRVRPCRPQHFFFLVLLTITRRERSRGSL